MQEAVDKLHYQVRIPLMLIQKTQHAERDQLSILLAVTLLSATLFRFVELPTFTWGIPHILGSPLNFALGGDWLLSLLMMGLVATGALTIMQNNPLRGSQERQLIFSLITPTLGALLTALLLIRATSWSAWLVTLLFGGVLIGLLVRLSYAAFSPNNAHYPSARTMLNILDYLIGFLIFSLFLQRQERALVTAPTIFVMTGMLALELLSASGVKWRPILLFSGIIALLESEFVWIFGYWSISSWTTATLLTLGLYILTGVAYQHLLNRLTRQIVIEFALVTLFMFLMVLWIRP